MQHNKLFEHFFYNSPYICFIGDETTGTYIKLNNKWSEIMGYEKGECEGKSFYKYIHPDDIENSLTTHKKIDETGEQFNDFENRQLKKNGEYIWLSWTSYKSGDKYYGYATPVNNKIDDFLSKITHELKTPLNAISGFTDLIKMTNDKLPKDIEENLNEISKSSNYLLELVNEILCLTRVSNQDLIFENVNIKDIIEHIIKTYEPALQKKNINLLLDVSYMNNFVYDNKNNVIKIFTNLIDNAIKYNINNGKININANIENNYLIINFTNTGRGIKLELIHRLYTPFDRLDIVDDIPGTGIGLSLVKKLIDLNKGEIQCMSIPDKETTFTIKIKLSDKHDINYDKYDIIQYNKNDRQIKIIYVEDNSQNMLLIEKIIGTIKSVKFIKAFTGYDGIDKIIKEKPDIILLDYHLPDINAEEIYKKLKDLKFFELNKNITICVLSADSGHHKIHHMIDLGFNQYFIKPIEVMKFKKFIESQINIIKQ